MHHIPQIPPPHQICPVLVPISDLIFSSPAVPKIIIEEDIWSNKITVLVSSENRDLTLNCSLQVSK